MLLLGGRWVGGAELLRGVCGAEDVDAVDEQPRALAEGDPSRCVRYRKSRRFFERSAVGAGSSLTRWSVSS